MSSVFSRTSAIERRLSFSGFSYKNCMGDVGLCRGGGEGSFLSDPFFAKGVQSEWPVGKVIYARQNQVGSREVLMDWISRLRQLVQFTSGISGFRVILCIALAASPASAQSDQPSEHGRTQQVRNEIPYHDGTVVLVSDFLEKISRSRWRAEGHVQITFQDYVISGDEAEYDEVTREGFMAGHTRFSQKQQWLSCSRAEFNFNTQTGTFYDASGFTDREFLITARTIRKTGKDTYRTENGTVTACQGKRPKWSFTAARADIRVDHTAQLHHAVFKIKEVPVLYVPYVILPMENKVRNSGFVPFHTGNSTSKGRVFSEGYYQTLGRSADLMVYGDYFSLRGLAIGSKFRVRPNPTTRFYLEVYGIADKLNQGGVQLAVDGESLLKNDWRAYAKVNIASNFTFRQAFSDSFRSATIPQEQAIAFLTRNHSSVSTNIAYKRDEVLFPIHSLVIRNVPSLEFLSLGTPLGRSPFVLSYRASLDGLSRTDSSMETQGVTQRLDFYPRLTWRLPSLKGFSLIPSVGLRETYYGAQRSQDSPSGVSNQSLHRRYADLNIELRTPVLERSFSSSWFGNFDHAVEPYVTYRWIHGIKDLDKIIRFDEEDAIADTDEIEYGIVNRFFRERKTNTGTLERREFMSFTLAQKYHFDPTFGGAFKPGQSNAFYPLDSVTGFYQTGILSNLAPISAIFRLSPRNGIHNDIRADFDARLQRWRNVSLSTLWQEGKFYLSGTYFRIRELEVGMPAGNNIQGQIGYGSSERGLSSSFTMSYNFQTRQLLNSNARVSYTWDCCGLGAEFNQFDLGLRTESRFSFTFSLKGIGNFGNMKRPESLF
jgi:LPS-assembly protein